jgi:hypothetical protein
MTVRRVFFSLKNPHNIPARRFALKSEKKHRAIWCDSEKCPRFGWDISVRDNCSANTSNSTYLGSTYTNDTGLNPRTVFTGSPGFQVKEIEVFEITG